MNKEQNKHKAKLWETDNGHWAVASFSSPYFYFEGRSRNDVLALANRALNFYFKPETPTPS